MLVTLADMKTFLQIVVADFDAELTADLTYYSEAVENYCNRSIEQRTITETFYRQDFREDVDYSLYHFPLISITTINEKSPTDADVALNSRVNKTTALMNVVDDDGVKTRLFQNHGTNAYIEVVYEAGFAVIPMDIQRVVKELVEIDHNKRQSGVALNFGNNVQRISIPGVMGIDFDYSLTTNERTSKYGMLLGGYQNVLDYYVSERTVSGETSIKYVEVS